MSEDRIKPSYALNEPSKGVCTFCGRSVAAHLNYCGWECQIEHAKKLGGRVYTPNGLPIRCITADGTMLEHEHGDHPDYKFPVKIDYIGPLTDDHRSDAHRVYGCAPHASDEVVRDCMRETHALIYTDGSIALTMHECCYAIFGLRSGLLDSGSLWKKKEWRLSEDSIQKVQAFLERAT